MKTGKKVDLFVVFWICGLGWERERERERGGRGGGGGRGKGERELQITDKLYMNIYMVRL